VRILLSNDDGVSAPGLHALAAALRRLGDVFICAPEGPRSGASSAITLHKPLIVHPVEKDCWSVNGTPADAVKLALRELLGRKPDLVVSGINNGLNTGSNVLHSGTVAAALEGAQQGIPSFAVSRKFAENGDFRAEARLATQLVARLYREGPRDGAVFNINIPPGRPRGVLATSMELKPYDDRYDRRVDPRGRTYFWLRGTPPRDLERDGRASDDWAVEKGYVAVTPLRRDLTDEGLLEGLERLLHKSPRR
jgi:5'-nucleotidase